MDEALANDGNANGCPILTKHLAFTAEMYALLHKTHDVSAIHDLVKTEIRGHGYSFIAGDLGESIAKRCFFLLNLVV